MDKLRLVINHCTTYSNYMYTPVTASRDKLQLDIKPARALLQHLDLVCLVNSPIHNLVQQNLLNASLSASDAPLKLSVNLTIWRMTRKI